jgi:hypothetical protein
MNFDTIAQHGAIIKHDARMESHVVAQAAIAANHRTAADATASPNNSAFADHGERIDCCFRADLSRWVHNGLGRNRRDVDSFRAAKMAHESYKGRQRVLDFDKGKRHTVDDLIGGAIHAVLRTERGWNQDRRRSTGFELAGESLGFDEGHVPWTCLAERARVIYFQGAVAMGHPLDEGCQLINREDHDSRPFFLKGASYSLAESG